MVGGETLNIVQGRKTIRNLVSDNFLSKGLMRKNIF